MEEEIKLKEELIEINIIIETIEHHIKQVKQDLEEMKIQRIDIIKQLTLLKNK